MKLVHLATAPDQLQAEMWRAILIEEGIAAVVRPGETSTFLGVSTYPCRLLVAEKQLELAKEVFKERLGMGQESGS